MTEKVDPTQYTIEMLANFLEQLKADKFKLVSFEHKKHLEKCYVGSVLRLKTTGLGTITLEYKHA